jgi:hypothetical protein
LGTNNVITCHDRPRGDYLCSILNGNGAASR